MSKRFPARDTPGGKVGHAEIQIGDSRIMLADEFPEVDAKSPDSYGGSPVSLVLYMEDVDSRFKQALAAGAKELRPVQDQSTATAQGRWSTPLAINGQSAPIPKTSRPKRSSSGWRR